MREKILGESDNIFLNLPDIAEREEGVICFGIIEGGTP